MREYADEQVIMNTAIRIRVISDRGTVDVRQKIMAAYDMFHQVVKKYTRFNQTSQLAKLNKSHGQPYQISDEFYKLIQTMLNISQKTDGAFDPTVIDLLEMYGYGAKNSFEQNLADPKLLSKIKMYMQKRPKISQIKLLPGNFVQLAPKQRLDLGGIGKGFAMDLAINQLSEFDNFIINAGGDIYAKGHNLQGQNWNVGLFREQLPNKAIKQNNLLGSIVLDKMALGASGGWSRRVKIFHHLLNPKTGLPQNKAAQTFVIAPSATLADVWATAIFIGGPNYLKLLKHDSAEGMYVDHRGKIYQTAGFKYKKI